ncbi:Uncharacterised protein [Salmonella enterica subsp. arizonae]|nr:Uncharacterised protein [Salmonella enterica subsp. arizonae]
MSSSVLILRGRSRPQRTSGPTPSSRAKGTISPLNMVLKNGSPTEILPSPSCLCTSGSSVPSSTTSMAAISRTLLPSSSDSRDHSALFTRERTPVPAHGEQQQRTAGDQHHKGEDKHSARRVGGEGMHRHQHPGAHQERCPAGTARRRRWTAAASTP